MKSRELKSSSPSPHRHGAARARPWRAHSRRAHSWRARLLRDERGAAMTETVIMMPAFLILWGSVFYVFTLGRNIVEMNVRIRQGAWQRAYDGCRTTPEAPTRIAEGETGLSSTGGLPGFFGRILDTLFDEFTASRSGEVAQPPVLGGESQRYRGAMVWMCNEDPEDYGFANMVARAWSAIGGF